MYNSDQVFMILDYETYSECDLKRSGSYEYSMHPTTEVLCASFRIGTRDTLREAKVQSWAPRKYWNEHRSDIRKFSTLREALLNHNIIIVAHNALFEQAVTRNVLMRHFGYKAPLIIPHERFFCTAVLASVYALPRKLEGATEALNLVHQKDKEGHRLMLKWCKPRKATKNNTDNRQSNPEEFDRMVLYCEHDIYAETELFLTLKPHGPRERALWVFDQEINFRGIQVDRPLVKTILGMIAEEKDLMTKELRRLTNDEVQTGGQAIPIKKWLSKNGAHLPNLTAKTVEDAIKLGLVSGKGKRVLELRQMLNKTSLKKYTAFLDHTTSDGRVRFSLLFNGASTGRWAGSGVQLHNCPRGTLKDKYDNDHDLAPLAAGLIKQGHDLEFIRSMFGGPMEVFVSCIRGMMTASEGCELFVADFAAIEARMLFWLADHHDGCGAFAKGAKMYEEMAMQIFGVDNIEDITKDQRFIGKTVLLGAGYGLGWKKFQQSCLDAGREVENAIAIAAIKSYREVHHFVPKLWKNLEKAAIAAVENPSKTYTINHTEWYMDGQFLACRLPSGRSLYYANPSIKYERTPWGEKKAVLYHWGVNSKTKKWENQKTWGGVLTENCLTGNTKVFTNNGIKNLIDVKKTDRVFDGNNWVNHSGLIYRGKRGVIKWQGIQVTREHLILGGSCWKEAIHWADQLSLEPQKKALSLVSSWLLNQSKENLQKVFANVNAQKEFMYVIDDYTEDKKDARNVLGMIIKRSIKCSNRLKLVLCGNIATLELFLDALTQNVRHTKTMVIEELECINLGGITENYFLNMLKNLKIGTKKVSILTEKIIPKDMGQVTYGLSPEVLIHKILGKVLTLNTEGIAYPRKSLGEDTVQNGRKVIYIRILVKIFQALKLSKSTKKDVYDLLNCGPDNRFMILTDSGPVIAHNCVQAISRDLMAAAMLREEKAGYKIILTVHDEIIGERKKGEGSVDEFINLMKQLPKWAKGAPISAEGWKGFRYAK